MRKNYVYVVTMNPDWDCEFMEVYGSISALVQGICKAWAYDDIYPEYEEVESHILKREKEGYMELLDSTSFVDSERYELYARKVMVR